MPTKGRKKRARDSAEKSKKDSPTTSTPPPKCVLFSEESMARKDSSTRKSLMIRFTNKGMFPNDCALTKLLENR